jgi:uncharacterized protein YuzE
MRRSNFVLAFVLICILLVVSVSAFQGSSASYSSDNKMDSFTEDNADSASFTQRLIGGVQAVGQYVVNAFTGRFGILTQKTLAINITSHANDAVIPRGNETVTAEDDLSLVPNSVNFTAMVFENGTTTGFNGATCYFYVNDSLVGNSDSNSSGHCTMNYSKSYLTPGKRNLSVNFSISTADSIISYNSTINFSVTKYVLDLTNGNYRTSGCATGISYCYFDGDVATLTINVTETNETGSFLYDPQNISANGTDASGGLHTNGYSTYPDGNITRASAGLYSVNATVDYSAGTGSKIRWVVFASDNNLTDLISSSLHGDVELCAGDFGAWSEWSECNGVIETMSRTDSTSCSDVDTQSCSDDGSCFPAGTKILMGDKSYKNIEDVEVGDFVISYDEESGENVVDLVVDLESPIREHMCGIVFEKGFELKLTNEHPVYTRESWKSIEPEETEKENSDLIVKKLNVEDEVLFENSEYGKIVSIDCWKENVQTYNLKSIRENNNFYADGVLAHNKGDECTPSWGTWGAWGECIDDRKMRTMSDGCGKSKTDFVNCGVEICDDGEDNDGVGGVDCADSNCEGDPACPCVPDWSCSWGSCEDDGNGNYYSSPFNCVDSNDCDLDDGKPNPVFCSVNEKGEIVPVDDGGVPSCLPVWDCDPWEVCSAEYDIKDVLRGETNTEGIQSRVCSDVKGCKNDIIQAQSCNLAVPVRAEKSEWCFENYVEIYDINTNKLVSRIKEKTVANIKGSNIGFFATEFSGYCSYCFDGVKNYDEDGIDCGGSGCAPCIERGKFFDYFYYIKWILWILLLILLVYLIYRNRDNIMQWFESKKKEERKVRVRKSLMERLKSIRLPAMDLRIKFGRPKRVVKSAVEKVAKPRVSKPYAGLRRKLREWKKKPYYATSALEHNLQRAVRQKMSESRYKKEMKKLAKQRARDERARLRELKSLRRKARGRRLGSFVSAFFADLKYKKAKKKVRKERKRVEKRAKKVRGKSLFALWFARRRRQKIVRKHGSDVRKRERERVREARIKARESAKREKRYLKERKARERELKKHRRQHDKELARLRRRKKRKAFFGAVLGGVRKEERKIEREERKLKLEGRRFIERKRDERKRKREARERERARRRSERASAKRERAREREVVREQKRRDREMAREERKHKRAEKKSRRKKLFSGIFAKYKTRRARKRVERTHKKREKIRFRLFAAQAKSRKRAEKRRRKERKKVYKKEKKVVKKEVRQIKKRIRRKEVSSREASDLRRKLREWKKKGYYSTTRLQKKLDKFEGDDVLKG